MLYETIVDPSRLLDLRWLIFFSFFLSFLKYGISIPYRNGRYSITFLSIIVSDEENNKKIMLSNLIMPPPTLSSAVILGLFLKTNGF